ncbi:MBL fold metallo-hydrolase [Salinigranum halophilum]|jgi:glyoxylase-like metal-dependent hydrolase (beta-lactamase superfamily II)|uniref:MBL fold metallo-hydrolase n=1 Tax=Salinigranum halophilum TaxID=2565931 RepID=UPI00115C4781|nr:MBL fold metallo-hydrolase [Salinigranum halophilum]
MSEAVVTVTADAEQFTCNAYLLLGETPTLVDAGTMPGVVDVVAEHTDTLDRVVLTHQHSDHIGQLDAVLDAFDADLYAYAEHPRRTTELNDGDEVAMGDESFEVVYTPGHAADHVSFVSETRLFSGDVVVYNDGAYDDGSFGRTDMAGQSRERLIASLKSLLERLPDSVTSMYAGHGDPFHVADHDESVRAVVERALSRAERRQPKYPEN